MVAGFADNLFHDEQLLTNGLRLKSLYHAVHTFLDGVGRAGFSCTLQSRVGWKEWRRWLT